MEPIRWILAALRCALPRAEQRGTRKITDRTHTSQRPHVSAARPTTRPAEPASRGEDIGHVRPYLVAHERQQEARRQRARRRTLWLALHGVDIDPRVIHGVRVAS